MIGADVLDELYGADPGEFVAARTRLTKAAREAGDRDAATAIGALRKPTLGAWAINRLVRERPVEVESLLHVGTQMREAQSQLDVARLRDLRGDRERVLESFTCAARFVADSGGHPLSLDAANAVRATAVAVLADAAAADAVAGGALVRTLDYAGFGEVDVSDAVAAQVVRTTRASSTDSSPQDTSAEKEGGVGAIGDGDSASREGAKERGADDRRGERRRGGSAHRSRAEDAATHEGAPASTTPERSPHRSSPPPTRDRREPDEETGASARREAETTEARRRHEARLQETLALADQELARASLVEAEAARRAEKARQRLDDLTRLLEAAREESRVADEAAATATTEREAAAAAHEHARALLAELDGA